MPGNKTGRVGFQGRGLGRLLDILSMIRRMIQHVSKKRTLGEQEVLSVQTHDSLLREKAKCTQLQAPSLPKYGRVWNLSFTTPHGI